MKICVACSSGGHLREIMQLRDAYESLQQYYVTDKRVDSGLLSKKATAEFVICPGRNPLKLLVNIVQSLLIFLHHMPDVVISTGADTAVPTCILAKLFGKKLVFVESYCRISNLSVSGKLLYPLADRFYVQWPELKKSWQKAVYAGGIF